MMNTAKDDLIILAVDDDPGHLELIKLNLKRHNIHNPILLFYDGRSVLNFLKEKKSIFLKRKCSPYILLLDVRIPGLDGIEILQKVRRDKDLKSLPVIMVTTTEDPVEIERCFELGCNSYFTKPVNFPFLALQIKKYITASN